MLQLYTKYELQKKTIFVMLQLYTIVSLQI